MCPIKIFVYFVLQQVYPKYIKYIEQDNTYQITPNYYNDKSIVINIQYDVYLPLEELGKCCHHVTLNSTGFTRTHKEYVLGTYTRDLLVNNKPAFRKDEVGDIQLYLYGNLKGMWEVNNNQYTS